jgi:hypothetical protein
MSPIVHRNNRGLFIPILLGAFVAAGISLRAQTPLEARVATTSLKTEPQAGAKKIEVTVRLVDTPSITVASATFGSGTAAKSVPVAWTSFDSMPPANCAWLVIIDSSNPARRKTVESCVNEAGAFLSKVPTGDAVMIASLARDLNVAAGFEATREQSKTALGTIKADGDAALSTLIYQNVKQALADHLSKRTETRKCVVLLTDGKDETPGGPAAVTGRRDELIAEAKKQGVAVHTLGFAEKATEMNFFADIKDVSLQTDGLHIPAVVATHMLPGETWETLIGVMHGGGKAVLDLAALTEVAPAQLELKTASGKTAKVAISKEVVAKALPELPAPKPEPGTAPSAGNTPANTAKNKPEGDAKPKPEPTMPVWAWGGIAAVALALLIFAMMSSKRRAAEEEARAAALREAQARELDRILAEPALPTVMPAPAPLAFLEMCDATQTRHPLTIKGVKIGRGKHNDIVIGNDSVSGSHCVLSLRNDEWMIADLKSGNGVLVNGKQVSQTTLHPNDVIELGDIKMRFLLNR